MEFDAMQNSVGCSSSQEARRNNAVQPQSNRGHRAARRPDDTTRSPIQRGALLKHQSLRVAVCFRRASRLLEWRYTKFEKIARNERGYRRSADPSALHTLAKGENIVLLIILLIILIFGFGYGGYRVGPGWGYYGGGGLSLILTIVLILLLLRVF